MTVTAPTTTRVESILEAIRVAIAAVEGLSNERVHVRPIVPVDIGMDPIVGLMVANDSGSAEDGDDTGRDCKREMTIVVGLFVRIDPLSNKSQYLQAQATYARVHAALEQLVNSAIPNTDDFREGPGGVQFGSLEDERDNNNDVDLTVWATSTWICKYERKLGASA